eukprot:gene3406-4386_t
MLLNIKQIAIIGGGPGGVGCYSPGKFG